MAFTYNEPTVFLEYAVETAQACRARRIHTVAVTSGYLLPAARQELFQAIDAANVDLKAFSDEFYRRYTGARLGPVLETLTYLTRETRVWLELTTLLIPGLNDSPGELEAECAWIAEQLGPDVPLHFSAFHPAHRLLDRPRTPLDTLERARATARAAGLRYVYLGNVQTPSGEATRCPRCGRALVVRHGYRVERAGLGPGGRCPCGESLAGRWEEPVLQSNTA